MPIMKTFLWITGGVMLIGAGYFVFTNYSSIQDKSISYAAADFSWRIENAPNYEETMPRQIVHLDVKGKSYLIGESIGCDTKNGPEEPNEIARKLCWFGGGGDIYSVFDENGTFIVKHKWIQESGGPGVNAPPEGPWEVVLKIN